MARLLRDRVARSLLFSATLLSLSVAAMGRSLGYRSAAGYLLFWVFLVLASWSAIRIARRAYAWNGVPDFVIRAGVVAFAIVVSTGLVLGSLGAIGAGTYALAGLVVCLGAALLDSPPLPSIVIRPSVTTTVVVSVLASLLTFIVGFAMTHAPLTLYDSLSYHLYFPARWLQDARLSIIATPFSDPAQAYAPGNGELFLLWLMLPFHGDLVARVGQLPFTVLGALVLFALARRSGARTEHAIYAPAFYLLARPVVEQSAGANVDLICSAMFLSSLYLGIVAVDRDETGDWLLWGVSLGLYAGTKYLALVYLPVLLMLPFVRGIRPRAVWALPGLIAFAAPWYVRNWLIAGSPIYPASLSLAGFTLARGAFGRGAMVNTVFHVTDSGLLRVILAHAFGTALFIVWAPLAAGGAVMIAMKRRWWPAAWLALTPVLMVMLFWFGSPVNIDSRFLLAAVCTAMLPLVHLFGRHRATNALTHVVFGGAIAWVFIGKPVEIPATVPWFMGGWLTLSGLLDPRFVSWFVALAMIMALAFRFMGSRVQSVVPAAGLVCGAAAAGLAIGAERWCAPYTCDYLQTTLPDIRANYLYGWRWMDEHVAHATVAYTGINLPYPLIGKQLTNRVYYVNIDEHRGWRFHDYARNRRRIPLEDGPLARASGELQPATERDRAAGEALRPRYERMSGSRQAWVGNLKALGVDRLFVAALSAYEIDEQWHNAGGFPIEDEWARSDPDAFQLTYENPQVRIYSIDFGRRAGA